MLGGGIGRHLWNVHQACRAGHDSNAAAALLQRLKGVGRQADVAVGVDVKDLAEESQVRVCQPLAPVADDVVENQHVDAPEQLLRLEKVSVC